LEGFTLHPSEYQRVPEIILVGLPAFSISHEYESLADYERSLPGVVAGAFTRFIVRLQGAERKEQLSEEDKRALADGYRVLETLARKPDRQIQTLIRDEIFDNIRADEETLLSLERALGPQSRALFDEWAQRNST
jgi:hypothetical protein